MDIRRGSVRSAATLVVASSLGFLLGPIFRAEAFALSSPSIGSPRFPILHLAPPSPLLTSSSSSLSSPRLPKRTFRSPSRGRGRSLKSASSFALAVAASSSSELSSKPETSSGGAVLATGLLIALDVAFKTLFSKYDIPFPPSLAGCGALFASLLLLDAVPGGGRGKAAYGLLNPGAAVLAKWLPVFFVPSLIALPLAPSLGSAAEVIKISGVIVGGFFFTLFTTAWTVLGVRKLVGGSDDASVPPTLDSAASSTSPKAFTVRTFRTLTAIAFASFSASVAVAKKSSASSSLYAPLQSIFLLFTTLSTFVFGANLPKRFTKVVHPLVTTTTLTWAAAKVLASFTGSTFLDVLRSYRTGSLSPLLSAGAGDVLLFLLGPAVVALACQMYGRKKLMRDNVVEVGASTAVSSLGGLFGTAAAARLLGIGNPLVRLSLLSRNITSPLAIAIAGMLGADVSLAVTIVVITGLIGANFGASILEAAGIRDPVARGLGIGAAAHGLGTAAFANEKDAFPFAAISMALTASTCTVLTSVPYIREKLLRLALGA